LVLIKKVYLAKYAYFAPKMSKKALFFIFTNNLS